MVKRHVVFIGGSLWGGFKEAVPIVMCRVLLKERKGMESSLVIAECDRPYRNNYNLRMRYKTWEKRERKLKCLVI